MSSLRAKIIDRNRYSKKYPFVKGPKRPTYLGDDDLALELGSLTFTNENAKTFTFEAPFSDSQYTVVAIPREISAVADGSAMVSLVIDGLTADNTKVTIKASAKFTGKVDVLAIRIGK